MDRFARLTTAQADQVALTVLDHCHARGLIRQPPPGLMAGFHAARATIRDTFRVPRTALTPLMARVLYGIAATDRPARVLGIGTYAGSLFGYLTAAGFGPSRSYRGGQAVGLDTDADSVGLARANATAAGYDDTLTFLVRDGRTASQLPGAPWNLLFLDADDATERKRIYCHLLDGLRESLAPGALVLAHDVCYPTFRDQVEPYLAAVRVPAHFAVTLTLPVDEFGLEVSQVAAARREQGTS